MNPIQNRYDECLRPEGLVFRPHLTNGKEANFDGRCVGEEGAGLRREDESDCSWTHEEDNGTFYFDIRQQLDNFLKATDQMTMTTPMLSRHHRRFVHASAQVQGLGHASLGAQGKYRKMIVFKHDNQPARTSSLFSPLQQAGGLVEDQVGNEQFLLPEPFLPRKRRRQSRVDGGFPCQFTGCNKVFDRASEQRKHEQSHQRTFTTRHQCSQCEKGFRYPKDLRRHQKVHEKTPETNVVLDDTPLPSTLVAESRVPSDTSLTFTCETISKDNSPKLDPWLGAEQCDFDVEPLVLGLDSWGISDAHLIQDQGFQSQELGQYLFEEDDLFDDDFLEMARPKK